MIKLTKNAGDKVRQIIESKEKKPIGLQAGVKGGGCSGFTYYLDFIYEKDVKDRELESEGVKIYIDSKALMTLIGTEMDYVTDKLTSEFIFNNPNIKGTCGCGESFSV